MTPLELHDLRLTICKDTIIYGQHWTYDLMMMLNHVALRPVRGLFLRFFSRLDYISLWTFHLFVYLHIFSVRFIVSKLPIMTNA